jgi:hypothetical protein
LAAMSVRRSAHSTNLDPPSRFEHKQLGNQISSTDNRYRTWLP